MENWFTCGPAASRHRAGGFIKRGLAIEGSLISFAAATATDASVAQPGRASRCQRECRGFESLRSLQFSFWFFPSGFPVHFHALAFQMRGAAASREGRLPRRNSAVSQPACFGGLAPKVALMPGPIGSGCADRRRGSILAVNGGPLLSRVSPRDVFHTCRAGTGCATSACQLTVTHCPPFLHRL